MSIITKALSGLLLLVLALGGILVHRNQALSRNLKAEQAKVQILEHSLVATRNSLNVYMARAKETAARAAKNQKELTRALQAHPDWRDNPVPDAVFDSVYHDRPRATPSGAAR